MSNDYGSKINLRKESTEEGYFLLFREILFF